MENIITYETGRRWPAVCVDIETLDVNPTARILEIGAVCFDPAEGALGPCFLMGVTRESQWMRTLDEGTVLWWAARVAEGLGRPMEKKREDAKPLGRVGIEFMQFMAANTDFEKVHVWAWGMDFDFPILANAFPNHGLWKYHNQRCARTLCTEMGVKREGEVKHTALEDACQEAWAVIAALRKIEEDAPVERVKPDFAAAWEEYRTQLRDTAGYPLPGWDEAPEAVKEAFALAGWKLVEG